MKELLGSQTKEQILLYLGLRGGATGRRLARIIKKSPSQVFKALRQLETAGIVLRFGTPSFYILNSNYIYFDELVGIISKWQSSHKRKLSWIPNLPEKRKIDPYSVYEFLGVLKRGPKCKSFSHTLRKWHA